MVCAGALSCWKMQKSSYSHKCMKVIVIGIFCGCKEDMVAGFAFQLGVLMPLDTASFQLPSGYGITCLPMSSCLLPSRSSSPDWQVPWWCRGQIRSTLFLSAAHLARFYLFCLEFNSCSRHFMHPCHARHYSQEDMCIIGKERKKETKML